jgi:hypothetical protein
MQNSFKFSCCIGNTDITVPLGIEIWLNDQCVFNDSHVKQNIFFEHEILDSENQHSLKFVMKGKKPEHTQISTTGEIVSDARLIITDVCFDEIALGHVLTQHSSYSHNFNGTGASVNCDFFGEMGCNGTVELKFSTPIYLWLLENL